MGLRNLLPAVTVTLAILSHAQVGWTANYDMEPQPPGAAYAMQPQAPPGAAYAMQPQAPPGACGFQPQPSAAAYGYGNGCPPDAGYGQPSNFDVSCGAGICPPLQFFGEFLFLRPRNAGLEYAVPINGPIAAGQIPIQMGRTAALNPDFSPGLRAGGAFGLDNCTTVSATYSHYENNIHDALTVNPPLVIRSMVMHPSSFDAAADWNEASAQQYINFDLGDIDYRQVFYADGCASVNYLVGLRYASLKQRFDSEFTSIIAENVNTQVNFEGAGFRLGMEAERVGMCDIFLYGKATASFLGGEFRGSYLQSSINNPVIAQTDWKEARLVSILDCEVGIGWTGFCGHVRASAGYTVSSWLNVVKSSEFISAVQANKYHGPDKIDGNGLVFDGLVGHIELRR